MNVDSKYIPGMFNNTRAYFKKNSRFLIKKDKTVIKKFDPYFPLKKVNNFYELYNYLLKEKINFYIITEEIENNKFRNYIFQNGQIKKIMKSERNYYYD